MRSLVASILMLALPGPVLAAAPEVDPIDYADLVVMGGRREGVISVADAGPPAAGVSEGAIERGAAALGLEVSLVRDVHQGIEAFYLRDYKASMAHWRRADVASPGADHVGRVLVYQGLMLENFDYRYEDQYLFHSAAAIEALQAALEAPGTEAWERLLLGGVIGVEAIHMLRRADFLPALNRGLEAIGHIKAVRRLAPDFVDVLLADGLFQYWRSVIVRRARLLPSFSDERAAGVALMRQAQAEATFIAPSATLALSFTWVEEREHALALQECARNDAAYPDNVINALVTGRIQLYLRRYDDALATFDGVRARAPDNHRVHYYLATTYLRRGAPDAALAALRRYLVAPLGDESRAAGLRRLGDAQIALGDLDAAAVAFTASLALEGNKRAKEQLQAVRRRQRAP